MNRLPRLRYEDLSPEQQRLHDEIAKPRQGQVAGPFAIWLRLPKLAQGANELGNAVRLSSSLEPRVFELVVLIAARHWKADYPWTVHVPAAIEAGLPAGVIDQLKNGARPVFDDAVTRCVYDLVTELLTTGTLSGASYADGRDQLGVDALIEVVTVVGFYSTCSLVTNAFGVEPPDVGPGSGQAR